MGKHKKEFVSQNSDKNLNGEIRGIVELKGGFFLVEQKKVI